MSKKAKIGIVSDLVTIVVGGMVLFAFAWGLQEGFLRVAIQRARHVSVASREYENGFEMLLEEGQDIDTILGKFRKVNAVFPEYKSAYEMTQLIKEAKGKYTVYSDIRYYVLSQVLEKELVVPTLEQYQRILKIVSDRS